MQFFDLDDPYKIPFFILSLSCVFYGMWEHDKEDGALVYVIRIIYYIIALPFLIFNIVSRGMMSV